MKPVLVVGAAALLLPLVAAAGPAAAGTDITPPAIGSCYDLTYEQITAVSSDEPAVACSTRHTTTTFDVVEFPEAPDWNDEDTYKGEVYDQCNLSWIDVLGGNPKTINRSSYTYYWLLPTPAQREAGAAWVRCELALRAGGTAARLPEDVRLGRLPLPDSVARCVEGDRTDNRDTICTRRHAFRATHSIRLPGDRWRGDDKVQQLALEACQKRLSGTFRYSWPSSKYWWRLGFRYATCLKKTRARQSDVSPVRPGPTALEAGLPARAASRHGSTILTHRCSRNDRRLGRLVLARPDLWVDTRRAAGRTAG